MAHRQKCIEAIGLLSKNERSVWGARDSLQWCVLRAGGEGGKGGRGGWGERGGGGRGGGERVRVEGGVRVGIIFN